MGKSSNKFILRQLRHFFFLDKWNGLGIFSIYKGESKNHFHLFPFNLFNPSAMGVCRSLSHYWSRSNFYCSWSNAFHAQTVNKTTCEFSLGPLKKVKNKNKKWTSIMWEVFCFHNDRDCMPCTWIEENEMRFLL